MNVSVKKRFWTDVSVADADRGGFAVHLDDRPIRTPNGTAFVVPARRLADAVASEWQAIDGAINPADVPFTKLSNAAIDKVTAQFDDIVEMLAGYAETDLLCHRAESPEGLVARQDAVWGPPLQRMAEVYRLPLTPVIGILPHGQPAASVAGYRSWLQAHDNFALMALHDLITISGSVVLAHAVAHRDMSAQDAWAASRVDEDWQAEQWGQDSIAMAAAAAKEDEFLRAATLLEMLQDDPA